MFPYGAQYYRTPNPPESEWEKDFRIMADHGFTIAKIWAMWNWMNHEQDRYDFSHFDRLFELAEKNGLKLVINTILENAPYWFIRMHPDACYTACDGTVFQPIARSNTPGGGWPGLCMDNEHVKAEAEKFLLAVGARYADNATLWGYDVWNEVFFEPIGHPPFDSKSFCYCKGTSDKFIGWLKARYGDIEGLNKAWYRRYCCWEEVYAPRWGGSYPDWLDWWKFRLENQRDLMRWRIETLRSVDTNHPLSSHGIAYTLHGMPTHLTNDFDIAGEVDQWGLSAFPKAANQHPSDYFRQLDLARSASVMHGKTFWQNELQGGQSGGGLSRSRMVRAEDTAFWNWSSFMAGAKGLMYWQWRAELLGPESPGYGLCNLDGSPSDRTAAAGFFADFMNANPDLAESAPIRGEVAIIVIPESQLFTYIASGRTDEYAHSVFGTYRALWDANVQVDFCTLENIGDYPLVFLPFPLMLEQWQADKLKEYVANGGVLVSDAAPGQHMDHGYTCTRIPGMGLHEVFGAVEDEMECVSALTDVGLPVPTIQWNGKKIACSTYQERLIPGEGIPSAYFSDGSVSMVDNTFGRGKTRLIGTSVGTTYFCTLDPNAALLIRDALGYAGILPAAQPSDTRMKARIHKGIGGVFLWLLNTSPEAVTSEIALHPESGSFTKAQNLATKQVAEVHSSMVRVALGPRQGTVLRMLEE